MFLDEEEGYEKIRFVSDVSGKLTGVRMVMEPELDPMFFEKQPSERLKDADYLNEFVGTYELEGDDYVLTAEDGKLHSSFRDQEHDLIPIEEDEFQLEKHKSITVSFVRNKKGKIVKLISHQPNGDFEAKKK